MTKAIRIATQARLVGMLRTAAITMFASAFLAACGGGAATTENQTSLVPGNNNNSAYAGPAALDAERLFREAMEHPDLIVLRDEAGAGGARVYTTRAQVTLMPAPQILHA